MTRVEVAPHIYHVHALLRSYLRADLVRQDPERAARLNGLAAAWYAAHDQPAPALAHAGRAADPARVTDLLHRHAAELIIGGNHTVVREVLELLGPRRVAEDSLLALASALLHLDRGDLVGAGRDLAHADAAWPAEPTADLVALRQFARSRHAQVRGDFAELFQSTESHPGGAGVPDAATMLHHGEALLAAGDLEAAQEWLSSSRAAAREGGHDYVAMQSLTALAGLAAAEGDYAAMVNLAVAADEQSARHGWERTVEAAAIALLLAYGALLRGDADRCRRQALRASEVVAGTDPSTIPWLHLATETLRGAAEFELGDRASGIRRISAAIEVAGHGSHLTTSQVAISATCAHRGALLLGWSTTATATLRWAQSNIPESAEVHLMRAKAQLAVGRREAAGKIIRPVLDGRVLPVLHWTPIEAWLLSAELTLAAGDDTSARRALDKAMHEAARLDVPHPLVSAAPEVVDLLTNRLGKLDSATERFAQRVFALRAALDVPPMVPLTARERAVLRLLPTLRSFDEIAEDLTVSANTVKTHVRSIYLKLGVTKRRDAVAAALERGLLE